MLSLEAFAGKYGLTRDTVYFYIKEGLLAPPKRGRYDFDEETEGSGAAVRRRGAGRPFPLRATDRLVFAAGKY